MSRKSEPSAEDAHNHRTAFDLLYAILQLEKTGGAEFGPLFRGSERAFGRGARLARSRAGLTRSELAQKAGVPVDVVVRWEESAMSVSYAEQRAIADALR